MNLNIKNNIKQFTKQINYKYKDQIPFAISKTINELTTHSRDEVKKQIPNIFNNKKNWYSNKATGILRTTGNKFNLKGNVYVGNRNYFAFIQEFGGIRKPNKGRAFAIPFQNNLPKNRLKSGSVSKYLKQKNVFITKQGIVLQRKYRKNTIALYRFKKQTKLKPRFKFYEICKAVSTRNLEKCFYRNLREAIKTRK